MISKSCCARSNFLKWLLVMVFAYPAFAFAEPPIVYVAGDGSGDYNCSGSSDQVEINQALDFVAENPEFTTVYLKGPNTYLIDEPIVISSNTIWTGDSNAKVQLKDNAGWALNKPLISQKGADHWNGTLAEAIYGTEDDSISNVEISGFEISGCKQAEPPGSWYVILMIFYSASNLTIHDMNLHDSRGDIIRIMSTGEPGRNKNIKFYNNRMEGSGHEGLYLGYVTDLELYDNEIYTTRTNCGIRLAECSLISVHGNTIGNSLTSVPSGYAGILVTNSNQLLGSAEIYGNYIFGKAGGIVLAVERSSKELIQNVHIHHNRMYKIFDNTAGGDHFLNGGIHIFGAHNTFIEFNTIESSYKDGIIFETGVGHETGYKTIVRNNIITNCAGYGINNLDSDNHSFVLDYNDVYNNAKGNYNNASSTTDIHADPLYANATGSDPNAVDFHLQSEYGRWNGAEWVIDNATSPCIDQGDPAADYSNEPSVNGGRVNIGAFGNTEHASKSKEGSTHSNRRKIIKQFSRSTDQVAIWLDTDIGGDIDDAVCLLLAIRHPQIELVGISTVRGCIGAIDVAAWLCREMLQRSGGPQIPVLPGAVATLSGGGAYPDGRGTYGRLGPAPKPLSPEDDEVRLEAIAEAMHGVGKPFHLVTIGPLTNAAWIVERHPEVAKQWETVTCMAGQLTDEPECNVRLDPEAARIVCEKLTPRLVGMEAIGPAIPREEADAALDPTDPASAFLVECYTAYRSQADWSGYDLERRPLTVFDPTTLLSVVRADAFDFKPVHLAVEKDGRLRLTDGGAPVHYAFSSDWAILKPLILALLRGEGV